MQVAVTSRIFNGKRYVYSWSNSWKSRVQQHVKKLREDGWMARLTFEHNVWVAWKRRR